MFRRLCFTILALVPLVAACGAPVEVRDVAYDSHEQTTMDVYLPGVDEARPAVMFIHGGGWRSGSKRYYRPAARRLARSGFVAATIDYRLGRDGRYPRAVQDCVCALAFLRQNSRDYGINPNRIAVFGYSAGGHLAALIGVAAEIEDHVPDCDAGGTGPPQAVVSAAGRHDMRNGHVATAEEFLGGPPEELPERYEQASPISHVRPGVPPFLLVHGGGDWLVHEDESRDMHAALLEAGNDSDLLVIRGGGHLVNPDPMIGSFDLDTADMSPESWIVVMDFLYRTLVTR